MNAQQQQKFESWIIKQFFIIVISVFSIVGVVSWLIMSSTKIEEKHTVSATKDKNITQQQQQEEENQRKKAIYFLLMAS